jgi:periplasmic divalent cation tolerance protein
VNAKETGAIQVVTSIDSREGAGSLARALVERHLAACVQVLGPITSTYRWEGQIETSEEWLCLIKSEVDRYAELEAAIKELHPYDVPEILAMPVTAGNADYLEWMRKAVSREFVHRRGPCEVAEATRTA